MVESEEIKERFTSYEEDIFKAYLEENIVKSENIFEFNESNLSYYSGRYTSDNFFSPFEFAHVNSVYHLSLELKDNIELLKRAKKWLLETVHPKNSEFIKEGDKYLLYENSPKKIKGICLKLSKNKFLDFYSTELLLMHKDKIYQYLPQKNFIFKWKDNLSERRKIFERELGFTWEGENIKVDEDSVIIIPIFIPIREMLFVGERGYKTAILEHSVILHQLKEDLVVQEINFFSNKKINEWIQIDGVERSILKYFIF